MRRRSPGSDFISQRRPSASTSGMPRSHRRYRQLRDCGGQISAGLTLRRPLGSFSRARAAHEFEIREDGGLARARTDSTGHISTGCCRWHPTSPAHPLTLAAPKLFCSEVAHRSRRGFPSRLPGGGSGRARPVAAAPGRPSQALGPRCAPAGRTLRRSRVRVSSAPPFPPQYTDAGGNARGPWRKRTACPTGSATMIHVGTAGRPRSG